MRQVVGGCESGVIASMHVAVLVRVRSHVLRACFSRVLRLFSAGLSLSVVEPPDLRGYYA